MASFEQQRGRAELVGELPALLGAVTGEQVAAAAAGLLPGRAGPPRHRRRRCPMSPKGKAFAAPRGPGPGAAAQAAAADGGRAGAAERPAGGRGAPAERAAGPRPAPGADGSAPGRATWPRPRCWSAACCSAPPSARRASWPRRCSGSAARCGSSGDADRLLLAGESLRAGLPELLRLLAEVLTGASYPRRQVEGEAARLADQLRRAWSQPGVVADESWLRRMYGEPPLRPRAPGRRRGARGAAGLAARGAAPPGACRTAACSCWSATSRRPGRSTRWPRRMSGWDSTGGPSRGAGGAGPHSRGRCCWSTGPAAVQSNLRVGGPAPGRTDPSYAAAELANASYGGYFSSRLVVNIREDKGYTYSPRSALRHGAAASLPGRPPPTSPPR